MYEIPGARRRQVATNGIELSVFEAAPEGQAPEGQAPGGAPPLLLLHGFPELAYSWRHQILALPAAGYRVIVPDQRGYGGSSRPDDVEAYDIHHLTADLAGLLDALEVATAIVVGHDWGGIVAWQMPLLHPARVAGVVGVNTPFMARFPAKPTDVFRAMFGENHYIVRFQEPRAADEMMAANIDRVLPAMARRGVSPEELARHGSPLELNPENTEAMAAGEPPGEPLMSPEEMGVYLRTFRETGFTGGINWYRNMDRNWETTPQLEGARVDGIPCLMVTAEWDPFLPPALADGMPAVISDLEMRMIDRCGHWTQQERPEELNAILLDWLARKYAL